MLGLGAAAGGACSSLHEALAGTGLGQERSRLAIRCGCRLVNQSMLVLVLVLAAVQWRLLCIAATGFECSALLCSIKPMSSGLPDDLLVQLGRRCIDTTHNPSSQGFRIPSNAAPSTQQYRQRMAHYPPACQPGHSQPAALPPRPASSQSQPVPSGQNEPTAKIAAGNRSTGCWAAPGITDRFGPQAVCQPNQWAANDDTRPPQRTPKRRKTPVPWRLADPTAI